MVDKNGEKLFVGQRVSLPGGFTGQIVATVKEAGWYGWDSSRAVDLIVRTPAGGEVHRWPWEVEGLR